MKTRIRTKHLNPHLEKTYFWILLILLMGLLGAYLGLLLAYPVDLLIDQGLSGPTLHAAVSVLLRLVFDPVLLMLTVKTWIVNAWTVKTVPIVLAVAPVLTGLCFALITRFLAPELSLRETHLGGAEWATRDMLKRKSLLGNYGLVLGRFGDPLKGSLIRFPTTLSAMVISPPGTGKTVNLIGGLLADHPDRAKIPCPSIVVNDPKGEIYAKTAGWRSRLGPVFHIRWTDLEGTSFNPLSLKNIKGGSQIIPRRKSLIADLESSYVDPGRALSAMMVAARDFGQDWRERVWRDPTLHFAVELSGAKGLALHTDPNNIRRNLFGTDDASTRRNERIFQEISELSALHSSLDTYVTRIANVAVPDSGAGQNSIWELNGRAAFTGFCLFVMFKAIDRAVETGELHEASIGGMIAWLAGAGFDPADDPETAGEKQEKDAEEGDDAIGKLLDASMAEAKVRGYPARVAEELSSLKKKPAKERGSVMSTALGKLQIFKSEAIRARTTRSDITFEDLRGIDGRPVSVYFDVPLEDAEAVGIPTGFFLEGAAAYLISQDEKNARTRPVVFHLDEFWTLPKMNVIQQIPALGRGQWVQLVLIGQSYAQIAQKLGKEALTVLKDAVSLKIFFTMNDTAQAEEVSKAIGNITMQTENYSSSTGIVGFGDMLKGNSSKSFQGVPLVRPDELMSMDILTPEKNIWGKVVILVVGMINQPIKATPVIWFKDSVMKKRASYQEPDFSIGPRDVALKDWSRESVPGEQIRNWSGRPNVGDSDKPKEFVLEFGEEHGEAA